MYFQKVLSQKTLFGNKKLKGYWSVTNGIVTGRLEDVDK